MTTVKHQLSVYRAKIYNVLASGEETLADQCLRVTLRYPGKGSIHNVSVELFDENGMDYPTLNGYDLLDVIKQQEDEIRDLLQFAEESTEGVVICGEVRTWSSLKDDGYEFISRSKREKMEAQNGINP